MKLKKHWGMKFLSILQPMKVVTILGARPQFIKAAALSRAFRLAPQVQEIIIHTGQHYDENMSAVFFKQMQIPEPNYNLNVKSPWHGEMTGQMLIGLEQILLKESPDLVVVYGDTNSTLAGALASAKLHIPIAHVEAGLRSYNLKMPEEINRILTDRISTLLFCPSENSIKNLQNEGFDNFPCEIHDVGDIMKDTAYFYQNHSIKPSFKLPEKFILATLHRAENTDDPKTLSSLVEALNQTAEIVPIVLPLHPRARKKISELNLKLSGRVFVTDPIGYLEMTYLLSHCEFVLTDSGGLQKEAYYFNKYCITIRNETEWVELVEAGYNFVVGLDTEKILAATNQIRLNKQPFSTTIYGSGATATKIKSIITDFLST